jgi:hypothetical protein
MKAAELRIGNYINISKEVCKMQLVNFADIHYTENFENYEPIPLTEEWLMNFGFVKLKREYDQSDNDMYIKNDLCIVWYNSENENFMQFFVNNTGINIKHVHQLQNLYYCLCGEELKIIKDEN